MRQGREKLVKVVLASCLATIVGCGGLPDVKDYTSMTVAEAFARKDRDVLAKIEGILSVPRSVIDENGRYRVHLTESGPQPKYFEIHVSVGNGKYQARRIQDKFQLADFQIEKTDGGMAKHGDKVTVMGITGSRCLYVHRVE